MLHTVLAIFCDAKHMKNVLIAISLLVAMALTGDPAMAEPDYAKAIQSIAAEIAVLKKEFPELKDFSPAKNTRGLIIEYAYHTHESTHPGGWTAGVPNPDDDGLWFYIDLHEFNSMAQIHTQPMTGPSQCLGNNRVSFLILTGRSTRHVGGAIQTILEKHGVKRCDEKPSGNIESSTDVH
jgi:hypothetical protein